MHARRFLTGLAAASVAVAGLTLTAGPAMAAQASSDPDDVAWTPTGGTGTATTDLIGTGSDTTQHVMFLAAQKYNATNPAAKVSTYAATANTTPGQANCTTANPCTITLPGDSTTGGTITRPFGSGAGRALLFGSGNKSTVSFARTSATMNADAQQAGLQQYPFALDYVTAVVSGDTPSNAPSGLTIQQLVKIYTCQTSFPGASGTTPAPQWNEVGGVSTNRIKPYGPSASSGTGATFYAALTAANGGVTVNPGGCVTTVPENDPSLIKGDADAIAPYSQGLAKLSSAAGNKVTTLPNTIRAQRALYNVVRADGVSNPAITAMFGSNGFLCSSAATQLIADSGFTQLLTPSKGGSCGAPTQQPTTNLTVSQVSTATSVTVASASASSARVSARVTASTAPSGTVTFFEGPTAVATNVPLVSGTATATPNAAPGTHTYRAVYTPAANTAFTGSEGTGTGTVQKASASVSGKFAKATLKGGKAKAKGTVTVTLTGSSAKASGPVTVTYKGKTVGKGTLSGGTAKVTVKLKKLKKAGKYKVALAWAGDANGTAGTGTATVKVSAPKKKSTKK